VNWLAYKTGVTESSELEISAELSSRPRVTHEHVLPVELFTAGHCFGCDWSRYKWGKKFEDESRLYILYIE